MTFQTPKQKEQSSFNGPVGVALEVDEDVTFVRLRQAVLVIIVFGVASIIQGIEGGVGHLGLCFGSALQ